MVPTPKDIRSILRELRDYGGPRRTEGLPEETILRFAARDQALFAAADQALAAHRAMRVAYGSLLSLAESELCALLQEDYVNFYEPDAVNPYVALGAAGPWIVTSHGAVLHDSGGYGMLGMGHSPEQVLEVLGQPMPMANVMSPHFSQMRLARRLQREIGHTRGHCPFAKFICMNSGSEAVSVASRIVDIHAGLQTGIGANHHRKRIRRMALEGGFHGRTHRAAQVSDSTRPMYRRHLASFRRDDSLIVVPPNDITALEKAFEAALVGNEFVEAVYLEPVMGEGCPGVGLTREYYDRARNLATAHGSLLVVDSIQAALRAHGCLSIIDYPGFEDCAPPDIETYSKALNAGQIPLSVLALGQYPADIYVPGVYGNTMTTNPRALEAGCAVLDALTDDLRANIREKGHELKNKLKALAHQYPGLALSVTGTGLMANMELDPEQLPVVGEDGFEAYLRTHGIAMIHGGRNGLRFTPHFAITSEEIDLIVDTVGMGFEALVEETAASESEAMAAEA